MKDSLQEKFEKHRETLADDLGDRVDEDELRQEREYERRA